MPTTDSNAEVSNIVGAGTSKSILELTMTGPKAF